MLCLTEEPHVEHDNGSVQPTDWRGVGWTLQGHLRVRIRLLEDCDISLLRCRVSIPPSNYQFSNFRIQLKTLVKVTRNSYVCMYSYAISLDFICIFYSLDTFKQNRRLYTAVKSWLRAMWPDGKLERIVLYANKYGYLFGD